MNDKFTATALVRAGKMQFSDSQLNAIRAFLGRFEAKAVQVTFGRMRKTRSLKQNAYLWVVYGYIAEHTGMSAEDVHDWCRGEFLPRRFVTLSGKEKEIRKTTTELSTTEFNEYLERIMAWSTQEWGIIIPEPS